MKKKQDDKSFSDILLQQHHHYWMYWKTKSSQGCLRILMRVSSHAYQLHAQSEPSLVVFCEGWVWVLNAHTTR